MKTNEECIEILKECLTEYRFNHSLNVANSAKELALIYGEDPEKAYTAGLVHDICKDTPVGRQLLYMVENGMELTQMEIDSPKLYHAMCGSLYLKKEGILEDEDSLNAVKYHTTGRKGMSLLEKIIFIADFISAERVYDGVELMREKAARSLEEAIVEGLGFTIKDLISKGVLIHPDTVNAYNDALHHLIQERKDES